MEAEFIWDKLHEECGVFGIYDMDGLDVAQLTYYGLYALQHRGQESAGIAVNDAGTMVVHKDMGLVSEIFNDSIINSLKGRAAIGHVRYSTTGASHRENAQPLVLKYTKGQMALAHNGNLVNADAIRTQLEQSGVIFQTTIDSEVIAALLSKNRVHSGTIEDALVEVMKEIKGSYALTIMTPRKLIGARDPLGLRPLVLGKIENSYVLASETCALDTVGAQFVRDIEPGEIVVIDQKGIKSIKPFNDIDSKMCLFEYIYFARPDSVIDGACVHEARVEAGKRLAEEHPVDADIVIGVPDSGLSAAMGYAEASGIPCGLGLVKNRYIGRTFIQPSQGLRERSVQLKLNALRSVIEGKRVILIDDSIVRGTTSKKLVNLVREAGATEVHMRIASPAVKYSCYYGIDTPEREHLVAANHTVEEIAEMIGVDSLGYISVEGAKETPIGAKVGFCAACFDGEYPIGIVDKEELLHGKC